MAGISPQTLMQATSPALRRQVHALSPAASDALQRLRVLLDDSIARDKYGVCDFSKDPVDTWYPYGQATECRMRHVRAHSEFRQGIEWVLQHNWSTEQHELNDELLGPIVKLVMSEGLMTEPEARGIVWDHYSRVYGHVPQPKLPKIDPSRTSAPVVPIPRPRTDDGPLLPMPRPLPGDEAGAACGHGAKMTQWGCEMCESGDSDPQCWAEMAAACEADGGEFDPVTQQCRVPEKVVPAGEFPWMWVGIGAGALVLIGGGAYLVMRKSG